MKAKQDISTKRNRADGNRAVLRRASTVFFGLSVLSLVVVLMYLIAVHTLTGREEVYEAEGILFCRLVLGFLASLALLLVTHLKEVHGFVRWLFS